jgi:hypothetical protein
MNGTAVRNVVTIGDVCPNPNHMTVRKAHMIAGMERATMTGLSRKARAMGDSPIRTPTRVPTTIDRATPMPNR